MADVVSKPKRKLRHNLISNGKILNECTTCYSNAEHVIARSKT